MAHMRDEDLDELSQDTNPCDFEGTDACDGCDVCPNHELIRTDEL